MRCRCRVGSAAVAVSKIWGRGRGAEQYLGNRFQGSKRNSSDGQKRAAGTPLISLGPALWQIQQEKHTMCELDVQIGNSG
jgi:hypothetical protein